MIVYVHFWLSAKYYSWIIVIKFESEHNDGIRITESIGNIKDHFYCARTWLFEIIFKIQGKLYVAFPTEYHNTLLCLIKQ